MSKVYLDMDGVLFDFDRCLLEKYGVKNDLKNYGTDWEDKTEEQKRVAEQVREIMTYRDFWESIPLMEGARELWESIDNPRVLTALPGQGYDAMISDVKRSCIATHFGSEAVERVVTCLRPEKVRYAITPGEGPCQQFGLYDESNILVDDLDKNCKEWQRAGGKAVLYQNHEQAIKELKEIV